MHKCRVCSNNIEKFMSFGKMPIANAFLKKEEIKDEYFFELAPSFCNKCFTFQIIEQPDPNKMFHENYTFFTRSSKFMVKHFNLFANDIYERFLKNLNQPMVIEIGSNDGAYLEFFSKRNISHLGVEPSANVAKVAKSYGVNSLVSFMNLETSKKILNKYPKADAITAANVICHIPDINEFAESISNTLDDNGVFVFEEPYLGSMIEKNSYDQIYDEHVYIFSALSVQSIFSNFGMELFDLKHQSTHGGSMRYFLCKKGKKIIDKSVENVLLKEKEQNLNKNDVFLKFKQNIEKSKIDLKNLLNQIKKNNKLVAGYAATSKSTTILNYCDIDEGLMPCIFDTTPSKINKFSPGKHIPIKDHKYFQEAKLDYAFLFAWNHYEEIKKKEHEFISKNGKWITHVPEIKVY